MSIYDGATIEQLPVTAKAVKVTCDHCGSPMYSDRTLMSNPPVYVHRCKNSECKNEVRIPGHYAGQVIYEWAEEENPNG